MKKMIFAQVIAGAFLLQTFSPSAQSATEVARVNDKVITLEEVNLRLAEATRGNPVAAPSRRQLLDDMIKREIAIQEAKRIKLDQDPMVADRINSVLFFALIEKKLGPEFDKITISDAEAKSWYEKNPEIRTSHIFVALPPDASAEDEAKATKRLHDIVAEVKSGKTSFAEAAQRSSEDPSSSIGGDMDYRMKDRLDTNYYKAAAKLGKAGDMTNPVRTSFGMHVIRLTGKHTWVEVDRTHVKRVMLEEKRQDLISRYLNDLRQKAKVTVNDKVIKE